MSAPPELVTVFRSMDAGAREDCQAIADILNAQELSPVIFDDSTPGVPQGVFEVRVPPSQSQEAEQLIAENSMDDQAAQVDASANLDLVPIFESMGTIAEMQAMWIKSLLEANGIAAVLMGDSVLPNVSFGVRVARDQVARAAEIINDAQAAGLEAADDGEPAMG